MGYGCVLNRPSQRLILKTLNKKKTKIKFIHTNLSLHNGINIYKGKNFPRIDLDTNINYSCITTSPDIGNT